MITVKLIYCDGVIKFKDFETRKEAEWYAHNEGDHLTDWYVIYDWMK